MVRVSEGSSYRESTIFNNRFVILGTVDMPLVRSLPHLPTHRLRLNGKRLVTGSLKTNWDSNSRLSVSHEEGLFFLLLAGKIEKLPKTSQRRAV